MKGSTHLLGGLAAALLVERLLPQPTALRDVFYVGDFPVSQWLVGAFVAGLGALLPDIDEPRSTVANLPRNAERLVPSRSSDPVDVAVRTTIKGGASFFNIFTQTLSALTRALGGGHRGATHSLLIAVLLTLIAAWVGHAFALPRLWLWFGCGYLSHIVLDMLTINGLRVLAPFSKRVFHLLPKPIRVRTGGLLEQGVRAGLLMLVLLWIWKR